MGTDPERCHLVIHDNKYISRYHAEIVTENGHYYLEDKGSKNGTFINGEAICNGYKVEIFNGTEIGLANEIFTFFLGT